MNWVDFSVLAVIAISALLAFLRGLVREVAGVGAWVGAALVAAWGGPFLIPRMRVWTGDAAFSDPLAYAAVFLVALILFSVVAAQVGSLVRGSALGSLDRTVGVAFGVVRGFLLVIVAYIAAGLLVVPVRWPAAVLQARLLPFVYESAVWVAAQLPPDYRPSVPEPPGTAHADPAAFLQLPAKGQATSRP